MGILGIEELRALVAANANLTDLARRAKVSRSRLYQFKDGADIKDEQWRDRVEAAIREPPKRTYKYGRRKMYSGKVFTESAEEVLEATDQEHQMIQDRRSGNPFRLIGHAVDLISIAHSELPEAQQDGDLGKLLQSAIGMLRPHAK